jgi:hypothetical protein
MRSLCQQTAGFSDAPQRVLLTLCCRRTRSCCWQKDFFSELGLFGLCQYCEQLGRYVLGVGINGAEVVLRGMGVWNVWACRHPAAAVKVSAAAAGVDFHEGAPFVDR